MRHIPNILSGLRILMVGAFICFFINERYLVCLIIYAAAFLTDLLDGYLARRNGWMSDLGKVLDPLADKLMLLTALACFYSVGWLPFYLVAIVFFKELVMIIGGVLLLRKKIVVYADWFGKVAAGLFNISVAATLLKNFWSQIGYWNLVILALATLCAFIALFHYARKQALNKRGEKGAPEEQNGR